MPRLAVPLTDTAVRNAKPDASKPKGHTLPDGGGLYLHITQAGKYWRMDYRRPNGKRNTLAFGVYPAISLAQARERRELARGLLAQGIDPSDHKRESEASKKAAMLNTVEAVAQAYLENKRDGWSSTPEHKKAPHVGCFFFVFVFALALQKTVFSLSARCYLPYSCERVSKGFSSHSFQVQMAEL